MSLKELQEMIDMQRVGPWEALEDAEGQSKRIWKEIEETWKDTEVIWSSW